MGDLDEDQLRLHIAQLKLKVQKLNEELVRSENSLRTLQNNKQPKRTNRDNRTFAELTRKVQRLNAQHGENYVIREEDLDCPDQSDEGFVVAKFSKQTTERFSRQIILDEIGVAGQEKLLNASVLIIGCGGIGSPCIQYLAACGVGTLGLVDHDAVELSNLHRQVIHSAASIGKSKVASAKAYVQSINEKVNVNAHEVLLDASNAFDIIRNYDVTCDTSDNAPTRYLVNDACFMTGRPLISASALGLEGQLGVYCHKEGPCYRCMYPVPPPPETVGSCGENGVLGPVPGLMGTLQAVEAIKLLVGLPVLDKLLLYDAETSRFLSVKMRSKNPNCICAQPSVEELVDYELFCSSKANDKSPDISILHPSDHISVVDYHDIFLAFGVKHALIDVRSKQELEMVRLRNAYHVDIRDLNQCTNVELAKCTIFAGIQFETILRYRHIFVICRRGNDSQKAVLLLRKLIEMIRNRNLSDGGNKFVGPHYALLDSYVIKNIREGYYGWCKHIDESIPIY